MERDVEIQGNYKLASGCFSKQFPKLVEGVVHKLTDVPKTNVNNNPLKQIIEFQIQRDTDELLRDGWTMQEINRLRSKIRS
jgi:hypothetical protein